MQAHISMQLSHLTAVLLFGRSLVESRCLRITQGFALSIRIRIAVRRDFTDYRLRGTDSATKTAQRGFQAYSAGCCELRQIAFLLVTN